MRLPSAVPHVRIRARTLAPYLFVLPNMVLFGLFTLWPAVNGFNLSRYDSHNGLTFRPVGADNYRRLVSSADFWDVVRRTAVFTVGFVMVSTVLALALALLLDKHKRGRAALSAAFFLPTVVSPVVVGLIWSTMLQSQTGPVNALAHVLGFGRPGWLIDPQLALVSVIMVAVWVHVGFYTMIMRSGLQSIDPQVYQAATVDGANSWQAICHITLPLLRPTTIVVLMLATISGFQAFDFIYTLTGGGPAGASTLIVQYIYRNGFDIPLNYGLASAAAVVLFLVVFAATFLQYVAARSREAL